MTVQTKHTILATSKMLFAHSGYEGFSMRTLAAESGVGLSSIYHFFSDKDVLLKELFDQINTDLGTIRAALPPAHTAREMLYQRIMFQFEHIEDVVFVLKYYLHFRPEFLKLDSGYIPTKAYLHIEEVLRVGVENGEFAIEASQIEKQAKVVAHAINGFLLEYYPAPPTGAELQEVVGSIHEFIMRSLTNKEGVLAKTRKQKFN